MVMFLEKHESFLLSIEERKVGQKRNGRAN